MAVLFAEAVAFNSLEDILSLMREFESRMLSRKRWTHAAHLCVALWYLLQYDWPEAVRRVREGIRLLNEAHGVENTPERGYHETLTLFWLSFVRAYLARERNEGRSLVALSNELAASADARLPLAFYTRERLFSRAARFGWVEPDLKELPF
jgi:DNA-binding NtrC family response regulator